MASAAPLKDIDEQFLQCSICIDRLKEPKILQCLHRYCRDCLKKITKEGDKKVQCPTCRDEHTLPDGGIDGLKTDFNTKNIVEFIQLQESVEHEPLKVCAGCTKKLKVSAYCFRCNDFLCQGCHEYHTTIKILKDHRDHVFPLNEAGVRNLTIEKLSSLKDAPKCHHHPEKLSELVCTSCGNLPICVPCTFGAHRGHDLQEVTSLAKVEREKMQAKVANLEQYKEKIIKLQEEIRRTKEKLCQTVDEKSRQLQEQLEGEEETIMSKIHDTDEKLKKKRAELEEKTRRKTSTRKQELEKEFKEARARYEKFCEEERQEAEAGLKKLQQENESEKARLQAGLDRTNKKIKELLASLKRHREENTKKIKDLADHFVEIMKRFKTVTTTASSILAAKHDWTDVQCIPDVCRAIDPLIEEVQRELPELGTLAEVNIRGLSSGRKDQVDISKKPESVVDIVGIDNRWQTDGITSSLDSNIITTGISDTQSHITVINRKGEKQQQHMWGRKGLTRCDSLSQYKVVTVFDGSIKEVGVYDTRVGMYTKNNIHDIVAWPPGQCVRCVAVNHDSKHIIVGCTRQEMYVFNSELGYIKTLRLPQNNKWVVDLTVHEGNLLICNKERAYAFTMNELDCEMLYEFPHPGSDWIPRSICTDGNHFIYILWSERRRSMVVQYSHEGRQILAKRLLDEDHYAECITTADTEEGEKLVMATHNTRKLITYGLG